MVVYFAATYKVRDSKDLSRLLKSLLSVRDRMAYTEWSTDTSK
jgi:hypothetical protein